MTNGLLDILYGFLFLVLVYCKKSSHSMKITKFHVKRCEMVQLLSFSQSISFARCHPVGYVFLAYFVCCALHTDIVTSMWIVLNHNWLPLNVVLVFDRRRGKERSRGEIIFNCISTLSCVCVVWMHCNRFSRAAISPFHHYYFPSQSHSFYDFSSNCVLWIFKRNIYSGPVAGAGWYFSCVFTSADTNALHGCVCWWLMRIREREIVLQARERFVWGHLLSALCFFCFRFIQKIPFKTRTIMIKMFPLLQQNNNNLYVKVGFLLFKMNKNRFHVMSVTSTKQTVRPEHWRSLFKKKEERKNIYIFFCFFNLFIGKIAFVSSILSVSGFSVLAAFNLQYFAAFSMQTHTHPNDEKFTWWKYWMRIFFAFTLRLSSFGHIKTPCWCIFSARKT